MDTKWGKRRGGINRDTGANIYTLLCIKQLTDENLLQGTAGSAQCSVVDLEREGNSKRRGYMYMYG